jgi:hypothetical protein
MPHSRLDGDVAVVGVHLLDRATVLVQREMETSIGGLGSLEC